MKNDTPRRFPEGLTPTEIDGLIAAGRAVVDPSNGRVIPVAAGGADEDEHVDGIVARITGDGEGQGLASYTDEELGEVEQTLVDEITRLGSEDSDESLARMRELADHVDALRSEAQARETAAEEREQARQEVLNRVTGEADPGDGEGSDGDGEGSDDAGDGSSDDADGGDGEGTGDGTGDGNSPTTDVDVDVSTEQPQAQAAAATPPRRPSRRAIASRRPASGAPRSVATDRPRATITAAADVAGFTAGSEIGDLDGVIRAFDARRHALRGRANGYEQVPVVSMRAEYPSDRILGDDPVANANMIASAVERAMTAESAQALVAAGGLCAPVAVSYDLVQISTADRPVRDSLPQFQASRGGIRFMPSPAFSEFSGGVGIWTTTDDTDAVDDAEVRKVCARIDCPEEVERIIQAITACLVFGNFGARAWPEQTRNALANLMAWHAKIAERQLLLRIAAGSTDVDAADNGIGATRQILNVLDVAVAGTRSRHRTRENFPVRAILPAWARALIRSDLAVELPGSTEDRLAVADAQMNRWFAARNVNVTWALDGEDATQEFDTQAAGALDSFPSEVIAYVFHEGAHLFLDGGNLDLGLVRDSTLNAANDYQVFSETFENLATPGMESLRITIPVCPNGATAAAIDYDPCAAAS